jgi:hypothetical protein
LLVAQDPKEIGCCTRTALIPEPLTSLAPFGGEPGYGNRNQGYSYCQYHVRPYRQLKQEHSPLLLTLRR